MLSVTSLFGMWVYCAEMTNYELFSAQSLSSTACIGLLASMGVYYAVIIKYEKLSELKLLIMRCAVIISVQ